MAVSEQDKELIQEYRDSLYFLIGRLEAYGLRNNFRTGTKNNKVWSYARQLEKLHTKQHVRGGLTSLMDTMVEVEGILEEVYDEQEGYPRLEQDWEDIPFTVSREAYRLRNTLPGLGYRAIYEKFDGSAHRKWFEKSPVKNQRVFTNRLDKLAEMVEELSTRHGGLGDNCIDLLSVLRESKRSAPGAFELEERQLLAQCYGDINEGYIKAMDYHAKMEAMDSWIDKLLVRLGVESMKNPYNFRSLKISDYLLWREQAAVRVERLYMELDFYRYEAAERAALRNAQVSAAKF